MTDEKQRNDELDERSQVIDAAEGGDDTEGHMFLSALRERRLEKEARPNRQR